MPGVVLFKRRWEFASDDIVFPGIVEIFVRTVWLIVIAVVFHINRGTLDCTGGHLLKAYYVGTLILLSASLVLSMLTVYTSMQGTITNVRPRRRIPILLYIKFGIGIPELVYTILGTYWAFGKSYGCDREVVWTVKALVVCGWAAFLFVVISLAILFDPLGKKRASGQTVKEQNFKVSSDGEQFMVGAASTATRVWETRCKILCCCVGCDEQSQSAFSDIAKLMSLFFQDVDLVPTDIAAGLILLHRSQEVKESKLTGVIIEISPKPSSSVQPDPQSLDDTGNVQVVPSNSNEKSQVNDTARGVTPVLAAADNVISPLSSIPQTPVVGKACPPRKSWMNIALMTHYMKFAMASYGWPLFVFSNLFTGTCKLYPHCRCCNCLYSTGSVIKDNSCQCHTAAIHRFTGITSEDLIHASFHNKIYEIPFFVSIDREHSAVVVSIRGTLSLKDALTDLTAECDTLEIEGLTDCYAHKGILSAATFIHRQLEQSQLLEKAFNTAQGYDLVLCGHSLGAGAAALLATLLRPKYPELRCYAYSPPGGLLSPSVSRYSQEYVCSVVLGKDLIPRLSLCTIEDLKMNLLKSIRDCDMPKYRVLLGGCWQVLFGVTTNQNSSTDQRQTDTSRPLLEDCSSTITPYSGSTESLQEAIRDAIMTCGRSRITQPPLLAPGHLLHIIEVESSKNWCGTPQYSAVWSCQESFDEILVSPKMVSDHLPDNVMRALDQLQARNFVPRVIQQDNSKAQRL